MGWGGKQVGGWEQLLRSLSLADSRSPCFHGFSEYSDTHPAPQLPFSLSRGVHEPHPREPPRCLGTALRSPGTAAPLPSGGQRDSPLLPGFLLGLERLVCTPLPQEGRMGGPSTGVRLRQGGQGHVGIFSLCSCIH